MGFKRESDSVRNVTVRNVSFVVLAALLVGCGGGGSSGPGGGGVGPGPSVSVSGQVLFSPSFRGTVAEAEPNDTIDESQLVGDVRIGERVTMVGHADAVTDPKDGFHLRATSRVRITATLTHSDGADLDLLVYDPTGLQFVEVFQTADHPETGVFHAKGSFDVVVQAISGASNYELVLLAEPPSNPISEREPNDVPGEAQYLGDMTPASNVSIRGSAAVATDPVDAVLIACPAAVRLTFVLAFPAFQDFDLRISDATGNLLSPTFMTSFQATTASPETGTLDLATARLLQVEVVAKTTGGQWTLSIAGLAPPSALTAALVREDARPLARLTTEATRLRGAPPAAYGRSTRPLARGEAIVSLREGEEARGEAEIAARGGRIVDRSGPRRRVVFDVPAGESDEDAARRTLSEVRGLEGAREAEYAQANHLLQPLAQPNDTYYGLQWHYQQIRLPEAWEITKGSASIVVAVLDTGIAPHPDIPLPIVGYDFVSDTWMSRDGDGRDADPTDPGDLAYGSSSTFHGTHVAGTIGARTNNGSGVAGINWNVSLMHVRVLGRGGGTEFDIGEAIRYAARLSNVSGTLPAAAARVINMSLGAQGTSPTLEQACLAARNAGVLVVAAAGNDGTTAFFSPAGYPSVVSVGAVGYSKARTYYSNYGTTLDLVAPGGDSGSDLNADGYPDGVLSTVRDDSGSTVVDGYDFWDGTSMASPHVAGVAALVFAADPTLTADAAQAILQETAEDLYAAGRDNNSGYGLVDAYAAVFRAAGVPPPVDPKLHVSPEMLNFGATETTLDSAIDNTGGGTLHVAAPVVEDAASAPWVSAALVTPGDATKDAAAVRVTVSRDGLAAGAYFARVTVASDGGTAQINVVMTVVIAPPPLPDLDIHVRVIDARTGGIALEQVVNPRTGLSFYFAAIPVGRYRFVASTDIDRDGVACEEDEYCGAYPVLADPAIVDLIAGSPVTGIVFPVLLENGVGGP